MRRNLRYILLSMMLVAAMMLGTGCDLFIKTNDGKVDLAWYMGLTYEDEEGNDIMYTSDKGDIAAVALEDEYAGECGIIIDNEAFLNIKTVKENIDDRFYWDKEESLVLFTNATEVYESKIGGSNIEGPSNETTGYTISFVDGENCFINVKFIKKFVDIETKASKEKGDMPAIISLSYESGKKTYMKTSKDIEMRTKGNYQNLIVTVIPKDTKVTVVSTGKNWYKVRTSKGVMGYIPVKKLHDKTTKKLQYKNDDDTYTHVTFDGKVSLAWNQIYNQSANSNITDLLSNVSGVNVLSPTWFSLTDKRANLSSLADYSYVEMAHKNKMQVWALVNDFTDKKLTATVLAKTSLRQRLVNNIMYFVDAYDLDGINIDFEYINQDNADDYLQFLRELSVECRNTKTILSIDNYGPAEWNMYYDRAQQGRLADYIIIMNYDEHTTSSKEAGSVSSMTFARENIEKTVKEVGDSSRVITGIPFYTRIWKETPEDKGSSDEGTFIEDAANGNYYLSSSAVGMDEAKKAYKKAGVEPVFNEETGQNFVTYTSGDSTYSIWLEDKTSIKARLELMNANNLGGAAYWSLGQESDSIWKTIKPYFENGK